MSPPMTIRDQALLGASGVSAGVLQNSWKELDRAEASGSQAEINVTGLTEKDNLMILVYTTGASNGNDAFISFNGDEAGNYANRYSRDGGTDATDTEQGIGLRIEQGQTTPQFSVMFVRNIAGTEKLVNGNSISQKGAGCSNIPSRQEFVGKWASDPLSERINQVTLDRAATSTFDDGSEVVVLGCDDDEADSDTNFWQELANETSTESTSSLSTGVFTPKKYLWFQVSFLTASGTADFIMQNGNTTIDTGYSPGYAMTYNLNGAYPQGVSTCNNHHDGVFSLSTTTGGFLNSFAVNVADSEKLFIPHRMDSGAEGVVPTRMEGASKWCNTSDQIDIMSYEKLLSQTVGAGATFRVWGNN